MKNSGRLSLVLNVAKKLWAMVLLVCLVVGLKAEQMPVGKKVRVQLKSGDSIVGALRSSDVDKAVVFDGKEDKTVLFSDVEKIVVLSDQRMVVVQEEKPTTRGRRSVHRITPIAVSFGGSESGGVEICGYEFIGKSGMAVRVTPLSLYGFTKDIKTTSSSYYGTYTYTHTETVTGLYWTPVWFRAYAKNSSAVWPYVGGTLAYHTFDGPTSDNNYNGEAQGSIRPAADFGLDFGGRTVRGNIGGKAFFGEGGEDKSLFLFSIGLSIGWRG